MVHTGERRWHRQAMAFEEVMFRNSVWSHDNRDIILHSFGELDTPWNNAGNRGTLPAPEPVSKFSADSDDYYDDYDDYDDGYVEYSSSHPTSSPLSHLSRRTERHALGPKPGPPLQMSRTYTVAQKPRMYSTPQIRRSSEYEEKSSKQVQSDAAIRDDIALQEKTNMPLLSETLLVATICIAQLCARESALHNTQGLEVDSMTEAGIGQTLPITTDVGSRFRVANANNLSSSIAAYAVTLGTFVLIACRLGETLGNKRVFIVGLAWSSVWSLIVGASFYSTRSLFVISRASQGLGVALTLPTGLAMLRATRPIGVRKAVIFTFYAAMSPIGLVGGALGASIFVELAWWPWVFWAYSMTLAVLGAISCFTLPSDPRARSTLSAARAVTLELDLPGMITGSTSLGLFGFAWSQAHAVGWQQAYIGVILIMSVVLAGLFVMIETCYAPKPLIPYSAMSWEVFWIVVAIGCGWSCFGIWVFYGWQFVERLRSTSPLLVSYTMMELSSARLTKLQPDYRILRSQGGGWLLRRGDNAIHPPPGRTARHVLHGPVEHHGRRHSHGDDADPADLLGAPVHKCAIHGMGPAYQRAGGDVDDFEGGK